MREIYIIREEEEIWVENGEEELEFEQDLTEEVVTIEWWESNNASNDSIWDGKEKGELIRSGK